MAIDSKGNNHQPKGMPDAGKFAPKAGAGDDDDLWYKPRYLVGAAGTAWGGRFVPKAGAGDGDGGHALPFFLESSTITTHRGRA